MDSLITKYKQKFNNCKTEEDVRVETNILLVELSKHIDVKIERTNEVTSIRGGRADGIYNNVIFEYKEPKKFNFAKGIEEALQGRDEKDRGLFHYLINFSLDELPINADNESFIYILESKVGVGFDGKSFIFSRFVRNQNSKIKIFHNKKTKKISKNISEDQQLDFEYEVIDDLSIGIKKLSLLLRSTDRKRLSSRELSNSFAPSTIICNKAIKYLYELLDQNLTSNSRIATLFNEWNRIFGDIYGEKETDFTKFHQDLISMYSINLKIEIRKFLFVLQTYFSIVTKLLIHCLFESLSNPLNKANQQYKKSDLLALFSGNKHSSYFVNNFFEIHFFEWFIFAEHLNFDIINEILIEINTYETTTSIIKPEIVEDVLKEFYLNLIPTNLRHLMGEYYTPNWLVDFVIEKSAYKGNYNSTILDPCCGSGSFLTHAIKLFKKKNNCLHLSEKDIKQITNNIVGFDINPIAVISAKANYILALGDISRFDYSFNVPVYMCDSTLVPTVHAKQLEESNIIKVNTVVGEFNLPVFKTREDNDTYLRHMSKCIYQEYCFDEFYSYIKEINAVDLNEIDQEVASKLYEQLLDLHLSGKNGFWPIILKNSFAPLFAKNKFDLVIGNPPWITWKAMSDTYRKSTLDIWLSYGIFEKSAYDKITTHDDFAMAVTYVCIDHYLKNDGIMSFILPQTFVKSKKGGEGFRKLCITRDNLETPFSIIELYDMLTINPFRPEAENKTSVYKFQKNKKMEYPFDKYFICKNKIGKTIKYYDPYQDVVDKMEIQKLKAIPINDDERSPWLTGDDEILNKAKKYMGESFYQGRKGIEPCGAKGIYLLKVNRKIKDNIEIANIIDRSRLQKAKDLGINTNIVEPDFVYPMIGGRNFEKWGVKSYLYMLVPHYSTGKGIYAGIPESDLKVKFKKTYDWLYYYKDLLLETRIRSGKFFNPKTQPFYRLDNVGDYTFSPYKVIWKEQSKSMTAAVITPVNDPFLGRKNVVVDSKVLFCSFDNEEEAHYLCGLLNSHSIVSIVNAYTIDVQRGVDILENIAIPEFNIKNKIHKKISDISKQLHELYLEEKISQIHILENKLEDVVNQLFE